MGFRILGVKISSLRGFGFQGSGFKGLRASDKKKMHIREQGLHPNKYLDSSYQLQRALNLKPYLEGQGDLVSILIMRIIGVTIWVIGVF